MIRVLVCLLAIAISSAGFAALDANRAAVLQQFQGADEPTAKDAVWTQDGIFKIGVINTGKNRDGYAQYACNVLYENGLKGSKVWVQIVDIGVLSQKGKWLKIGEAHCQ